jgi:hypothetical protein
VGQPSQATPQPYKRQSPDEGVAGAEVAVVVGDTGEADVDIRMGEVAADLVDAEEGILGR